MIQSHSPLGLKRMDIPFFFFPQHLKEIFLLLSFTRVLTQVVMLKPTLNWAQSYFTLLWIDNLIAEVVRVKDSIKKPLETVFRLCNVGK